MYCFRIIDIIWRNTCMLLIKQGPYIESSENCVYFTTYLNKGGTSASH